MDDFLLALTHAAKAVRGAADEALQKHGVRVGQNLLLDALVLQDAQTPGQVAEALGVSTPTVVKMAQRMEAAGLVERHPDQQDRRLVRLQLTAMGRLAQQRVTEELDDLSARATVALTPRQVEEVVAALRKVNDALR